MRRWALLVGLLEGFDALIDAGLVGALGGDVGEERGGIHDGVRLHGRQPLLQSSFETSADDWSLFIGEKDGGSAWLLFYSLVLDMYDILPEEPAQLSHEPIRMMDHMIDASQLQLPRQAR